MLQVLFLLSFVPIVTAGRTVTKIQARYASTTNLTAKFAQTVENKTFGRTTSATGKVSLTRSGEMRWEYDAPDVKQFISDGTTLWAYEPKLKHYFEESVNGKLLPVAVTFLTGQGDLKKDFTAVLDPKKRPGTTDLIVRLTPRVPSAQIAHLWLVVDKRTFEVKESIIEEATGNENRFVFSDMQRPATFPAGHFTFTPPPGVRKVTP
jgi:outer membrane lipoprotein carrier protein